MSSEPVEVLCPECGEILRVSDVKALILTMHQFNACDVLTAVVGAHDG